jgi:ribosome recycling factor
MKEVPAMTPKDVKRETEEKMKKTIEVTRREFSTIRTGRATPGLVEHIKVDYYGTPTPLRQIATIQTPEARLIVIQAWDPNAVGSIEKAILASDLGVNPNNDGKVIRLSLPQLTQEKREELTKVVRKLAEDSKISVRSIRRDANDQIKKLEKDKGIPEDERFKSQDEIQKLTNTYIGDIDKLLQEKEKEILSL